MVPQFLLDGGIAGEKLIYVLQPRRLPTRMLARRIAQQRNSQVGETVGYQIRMDKKAGPRTRILFVTEGILLRKLLEDPNLNGIQAILLDEFHERHLQTDLALSLVRRLQQTQRPDLKLVVMSATLEIEPLLAFFGEVPVLRSDGRSYPVEIRYTPLRKDLRQNVWDAATDVCAQLVREFPKGDLLVFQPGAREIHRTLERLRQHPVTRTLELLPLFGDLSAEDQDRAVLPHPQGKRKIIVSTNVAETSLTLEGILAVVDSGLARVLRYDPRRGINSLLVEPIARSNADQRAGRAGRTGPGIAVRLWSQQEQHHRAAHLEPEIERIDLCETILQLLVMGIDPVSGFDWFCTPSPERIKKSLQLLEDLGAITTSPVQLTSLGQEMSRFPLHPRFSRMLLEGEQRGCGHEIADLVALAEGRSLLLPLPNPRDEEQRLEILAPPAGSDFFAEWAALQYARQQRFSPEACRQLGIHVGSAREADLLARQLSSLLSRSPLTDPDDPFTAIRRCILTGFLDHLAIREDKGTLRCRMIHGLRGVLRKESRVEEAPLLVAADLVEREQRDGVQLQLGMLTAIEPEWLKDIDPHAFSDNPQRLFDPTSKSVLQRRSTRFRDLVLVEKEEPAPPDEQTAALLAAGILEYKLPLKQWDRNVESLIARLNFVHHAFPEMGIPGFVHEEDFPFLVEQLCIGSRRYREIHDKPILPVLRQWCSPEQWAAVESLAPESFKLPGGRIVPLRYENGEVILAATIQQLYDLSPHPSLSRGRVPMKVELLAPNRRPVQITRDLPAFWTTSYPAIRKELAGRYPKHEWR